MGLFRSEEELAEGQEHRSQQDAEGMQLPELARGVHQGEAIVLSPYSGSAKCVVRGYCNECSRGQGVSVAHHPGNECTVAVLTRDELRSLVGDQGVLEHMVNLQVDEPTVVHRAGE